MLGFIASVWIFPAAEAKWALGSAATSTLICVLLYEVLLTRKDRELFGFQQQANRVIAEKEVTIAALHSELERVADPELMEIYREDERERLRINRESMEQIARDVQRSNAFADEIARKYFELT